MFTLSSIKTQDLFTDHSWNMDTCVSHHLISNLNVLMSHVLYEDSKEVMLGNSNTVPRSHYGEACLSTQIANLQLRGFLHVLMLAKNLVSIKRLCADNNVIVEFPPHSFCVKDVKSDNVFLVGGIEQGLYKLLIALAIQNCNFSLSPTSMLISVNSLECHSKLEVNGEWWYNRLVK